MRIVQLSPCVQTLPVKFSIAAVLTRAELEIGKSEVDFGWCGTQESVLSSLDVTNKSLLPQEVGFVGLPNVSVYALCEALLVLVLVLVPVLVLVLVPVLVLVLVQFNLYFCVWGVEWIAGLLCVYTSVRTYRMLRTVYV